MFFKILKILCLLFVFNLSFINFSNSDILKKIEIFGNDRISNETISMFSEVEINDNINSNIINKVLKNLYDTNFFEKISIFQKSQFFYVFHLRNHFPELPDGYFDLLDRYKNFKKIYFFRCFYIFLVFCLYTYCRQLKFMI